MSQLSLPMPEPDARNRFVDDGRPFLLVGPNERGLFVETVACAKPGCSCDVLGLILHRAERHGGGAVMREVQRRLSLFTSTGRLRDDATGEPLEAGWLRDKLSEMREPLVARFARVRAQHDDHNAWRRYDWSTWRSGDRVIFGELFPAAWDLLVLLGGHEYQLVDHHCVTPGCGCDDVMIDVLQTRSDDEDPLLIGRFSVDVGMGKASQMASGTIRELWRVARDRDIPQRIAKRQAEARWVASARAREERVRDMPPAEDARVDALRRDDVAALPEELRALGAALLRSEPEMDLEVEKLARGVGPAAHELLVLVAADPVLYQEDAAGEGWAPIHAARALQELGVREHVDAEGIARLLDALARVDDADALYDTFIFLLASAGDVVVEPALTRLPADLGSAYACALAEILAKSGTQDERIFEMLLRFFDEEVELGASLLTRYADPRALPQLSAALDEIELDADDDEIGWEQAVIDLAAAITHLDGELTEAQREKRDEVRKRRGRRRRSAIMEREQPVVRAAPKVGRNDPCPCGSGTKYKKCHGKA